MKHSLSFALVFLGVALVALAVYNINQYWVQQASIAPTLAQLEKSGQNLPGFDLDQTKALISASSNALLQMFLADLILGILFVAGGIWMAPDDKKIHSGI